MFPLIVIFVFKVHSKLRQSSLQPWHNHKLLSQGRRKSSRRVGKVRRKIDQERRCTSTSIRVSREVAITCIYATCGCRRVKTN
jgi:hypothetical protein